MALPSALATTSMLSTHLEKRFGIVFDQNDDNRSVDMSVHLSLGTFWNGFSPEAAVAAPPPSPEIPQEEFLSFVPEPIHKYVDQLFGLMREAVLTNDRRIVFESWSVQWSGQKAHSSATQLAKLLAQLDLGVICPSLQQEERPDHQAIWSSCHEVCCLAIGALLPGVPAEDFLCDYAGGFC